MHKSFLHEQFVTRYIFTVRRCQHLAQPPSWRTTHCRLSTTAYSKYLQLRIIPGGHSSLCNLTIRHTVVTLIQCALQISQFDTGKFGIVQSKEHHIFWILQKIHVLFISSTNKHLKSQCTLCNAEVIIQLLGMSNRQYESNPLPDR